MHKAAKTLHRTTALLVVAFLILHMITHLAGLWGMDAYNAVQSALRPVYRNAVVEPILLCAIAVQMVSGALLLLRKFKRGLRGSWERAQAYSGAVVLFFALQHEPAYLATRWLDGLDTTFYWPASVMNRAPFYYYFAPYYFAGVTALFLHTACAARLALIRRGHAQTAVRVFWATTVFGILAATAIVLMLLGSFYPIELPDEWIAYLQKYIPTYGT